jgi:hypothetical protein
MLAAPNMTAAALKKKGFKRKTTAARVTGRITQ